MRSLLWTRGFARLAWAVPAMFLLPVLTPAQGHKLSKEAIQEIYKGRDKAALSKLLATLGERPSYHPHIMAAEQILLTLGDKGGDLYDLTRKALLVVKYNGSESEWQQQRLARILARCDGKRAYRDFRRLLDGEPSRSLKNALILALPDLESEDGLTMLFGFLGGGTDDGDAAARAVGRLMYPEREHTPQITHRAKRMPSVRWAKMQDLAVPRLQKILRDSTRPGETRPRALWVRNFLTLVDEAKPYAPQQFIGLDSAGVPPLKTLPARMADYYSQEIGFGVDRELRDDIVSGRKSLDALTRGRKLSPSEKAHLQWLQALYGEPAGQAPAPRRPVLFRSAATNYQLRWESLADYLKKLDAEPLPADLSQKLALEPLYPNHLDEYLRRAAANIRSDSARRREYGLYCLESRFNWTFNLDIDDPAPALARTMAEVRPLLERMGRGTLVEARGALLVHFGVKLEGPPGKAWLPAVEKAMLSWNPTVRWNAARVLCMLRGDTDLMRFASVAHFRRGKELKAHLAAGYLFQVENFGKEKEPLPADLARKYRHELNSGDPGIASRAMQELVKHPQSALAFLRKDLHVPPAPDAKRCAALIAALNSSAFKARHQATEELRKLGEGVVPHLRRALEKTLSLEGRRRLEGLLRFHAEGRSGMLRALQVLETLPGPAARYFLEELASGSADATLTREARGSLRRVQLYWQW